MKWALTALAALLVVIAGLAVAVAFVDPNHLRAPLIRLAAARSGRQVRIEGPIEAHLLSFNPTLVASRVVIGNPPWMPPGTMAEIDRLSLVLELHPFSRTSSAIRRLEMDGAALHLARDSTGHANWQWTEPGKGTGQGPPLIRSLSMPGAHVDLDDVRRHLQFEGTVSAADAPGAGAVLPLHIEGAGKLNGRAATLALNGDPLATASHERPYRFAFAARSSGSRLTGRGALTRAFNFRALEVTFEAAGEDMKDLYFLTGVTLVNTGEYRLSGKLARQGTHFEFNDLLAKSGQSDMRGTVSIETSSGRSQLDAALESQRLRLADLGPRAAGHAPAPGAEKLVLPDTQLRFNGMRRGDAKVSFHARDVDVGRISLHGVAAQMTIDHGILTVERLSGGLPDGKLTGRFRVDATAEVPTADFDVRITDLQLGQFHRKGSDSAPLDGLLQARFILKGQGSSLHQLAATSSGTVTAVLPHGGIRTELAELSGLDLSRSLGLMLSRDKETGVRCGVASFEVHDGTMTARSLLIDTDPVLITGKGEIHLDSEALDLAFRGQPKKLRLFRVRAPVSVGGTLKHPSFSLEARNSLLQTGEAVALGVLLTPLAAALAFVDPGLAKDADCAALIAQANTEGMNAKPTARVR